MKALIVVGLITALAQGACAKTPGQRGDLKDGRAYHVRDGKVYLEILAAPGTYPTANSTLHVGPNGVLIQGKRRSQDGKTAGRITELGIKKNLTAEGMGHGPLKNVFGKKTGFEDKLNAAMSGDDNELVVGHGVGLRGTGNGGGQGFGRIRKMGRIDTGGGRGSKASSGGKKKRRLKARVRRGKVNISGLCKKKDILRVVATRQRGIQYCYEKELFRNPEVQGKVTMTWRVDPNGKTIKVGVASTTLDSKAVEGCMTRAIIRWKFAKPKSGTCSIQLPFSFNTGL